MRAHRLWRLSTAGGLALTALLSSGCGESGSNPVLYPEVRFQVQPIGGQATFVVERLTAGSVQYTSLATTELSTTGIFNVLIEQAPGPYTGQFTQVGDIPIRVRLVFNKGGGSAFETIATTTGPGTTVIVASGTPSGTLRAPNPEVRFDVCAPVAGQRTCVVTDDPPGRFGVQFGGTVGDFFTTHLLGQSTAQDPPTATPSIYLLQDPRDQVSGVFRSNDGSLLVARLYVNSNLKQVGDGTNQDVVVNSDI